MFVSCSVPVGTVELVFFHESRFDNDLPGGFGGISASDKTVAAVMNGYKPLYSSVILIASGFASSKRSMTQSRFLS